MTIKRKTKAGARKKASTTAIAQPNATDTGGGMKQATKPTTRRRKSKSSPATKVSGKAEMLAVPFPGGQTVHLLAKEVGQCLSQLWKPATKVSTAAAYATGGEIATTTTKTRAKRRPAISKRGGKSAQITAQPAAMTQ